MQKPQISALQLTAIVMSSTIGVGLLAVPRFAANTGGSGAPAVTAAGTLITLFALLLVTVLGLRFPNQSILQYSRDLVGRAISFIVGLNIVIFLMILIALISREFGEVVVTAILPNTPLEVVVLTMLLIAAISARADIVTFANIQLLYLPFVIVPVLLMISLSLKNTRSLNLLPLFGNGQHQLFSGILTIAALLQGSFIMALMIPFLRSRRRIYTAMWWGWAVPSGLYILIVVASVGVFGAEEIKLLMWPTLELAKTTALPANVLERLDAAFLAVWVTNVFTTLLAGYFTTVTSIVQIFHLRNHRTFAWFVLPFVFIIAMLPQSVFQMYALITTISRFALGFTIGYPALLLAVALLRRKRGKPEGAAPESGKR